MRTVASRARRWPLAFSLLGLVALGACADEPAAPRNPATPGHQASVQGLGDVTVAVTNTSGGTEVGSLRWAANQLAASGGTIVFDPSLAGDTITLDAELDLWVPLSIRGPEKGITISGNSQHRVIYARYFLGLVNVTITKGTGGAGAAIYAVNSLTIANSTVQDNSGRSAIFAGEQAYVRIVNSTISRNNVFAAAIEYMNGATVNLHYTTIAYNAPAPALANGYNVTDRPTLVTLHNSIISNNGSPQRNCLTTIGFEYLGTNISNDWSCGQVTVADPQLIPLANNGGPNMTHAIPHTSPAFNAGTWCWTDNTDQRYVPRDAKCDVGAFEFNDWTKVNITIDPNTKVDATGRALLTGTIKCTRNDSFRLAVELHQDQKRVDGTVVDVHSAGDIPVACTTSAQAWSAVMVLSDGATFQRGGARATAQTFDTPEWVTPAGVASGVKISFTRR